MMKVERFRLGNGLRVVFYRDGNTEMVHLNLLYGVGAKNESEEYTGLAHLLEHLMFEGTDKFPSFDEPLEDGGGDSNACTNNDYTNYMISLPRRNAELAFCMEADRMCNMTFGEEKVEVQRQVVMEEFKQEHLNKPYGDVSMLMRKLAFKKHPYRWSTIGMKLKHISSVPSDVVEDFYKRHYTPCNAVLAVVGNLTVATVRKWVERWFGDIPGMECRKKNIPVEPRQLRQRRATVWRNVPNNALYMAFHMSAYCGEDYYPCDVISDILANGYSGRLMQRLVKEKKLFTRIDAFISNCEHDGLFWIYSRLADGVSYDDAEAAIRAELEELQRVEVPQPELEKVRNRFESEQVFANISGLNFAANLALAEWCGDVSRAWREADMYRAVTAVDVKRVAKKLFRKGNSSVLYYKKRS